MSALPIDGFTEPHRTIDLAASESGVVAEILVREGQRVSKGQLLASLDTAVLDAALEVAEAQSLSTGKIEAARAERDMCKIRLEKIRGLRAKGHAGQHEVDRAEADFAVAEAKLHIAVDDQRVSVLECKRIEAQIERRKLRSPIDGVVVKVLKEVGEAILPSNPSVVRLAELNPLRAKFSVTAAQADRLKLDQQVTVIFPEFQERTLGRIESICPVADAKSGTVQVAVAIEDLAGRHRSGTRCVLELDDKSPQK